MQLTGELVVLILGAFILGFGLGWAVWRGPLAGLFGIGGPSDEGDAKAFLSIEESLAKARTLLEEGQSVDDELASAIDGVDQSVKRANGRLKLILKSIEKSGNAD